LANVANEEPRNTIFLLLPIEAGIFFSSAVFHSITGIRNNNGLRMTAENQPRPAKSLKFLLSTQFFLQNRSFAPETSLGRALSHSAEPMKARAGAPGDRDARSCVWGVERSILCRLREHPHGAVP